MLIILPPSETKTTGGTGPKISLEELSFPSLNPIRSELLSDLAALSTDETLAVLGLKEGLREQAAQNQHLWSSATMPAIFRFSGVLFDALDAATLEPGARQRLAIGDALFGLVRANDLIPCYRLSGTHKVPERDSGELMSVKKRWGKEITKVLEDYSELVVDLRSGTYQQLGKLKDAITLRVESETADGSRKVVSHFNKHYKGLFARTLASAPQEAETIEDVIKIARDAGHEIEWDGTGKELILVVRSDSAS